LLLPKSFERAQLSDPLLIAGAAFITLGVFFVYWPAGFIVLGLFCLASGWALGAK
jgi:hypothetical protein